MSLFAPVINKKGSSHERLDPLFYKIPLPNTQGFVPDSQLGFPSAVSQIVISLP